MTSPHDETFDELRELDTEARNPRSAAIDVAPVRTILEIIHAEDRTVPDAVGRALDDVARAVELTTRSLAAGGRIVYAGAGTSGRLGVLDAAECPPTFGTDPDRVVALVAGGRGAVFRSCEGAEDDADAGAAAVDAAGVGPDDTLVGIAASRRTPWVLAALQRARSRGAATVLLRCNAGPAPDVDVVVTVETGPEVITGSTRMKAGTAQKMVLNMISTATMIRLGKVYGNLMVDLRPNSRKLVERGKRFVMALAGLDYDRATDVYEAAGRDVRVAVLMARLGLDAPAARERLEAAGGQLARALGER